MEERSRLVNFQEILLTGNVVKISERESSKNLSH